MSARALKGQCLCGAVAFEAAPEKLETGACHCSMCRRWSGGVFLAVECASLEVADESALGIYKSSDWGERCFCKICGSTLFWRMQGGAHAAVSVQAFEQPEQFAFVSEIFVDEQPASYAFANKTKRMTGAEVIAAFQASAEKNDG